MCAALTPVRPPEPGLCQPCGDDEPLIGCPPGVPDGGADLWDGIRPGQQSIGDLVIVGKQPASAKTGMPSMPRPLPSPRAPSQAERDLHNLTHLPYAVWCPYCISGKRPNHHHRRLRGKSKLPSFSADYCYFGDGDLVCLVERVFCLDWLMVPIVVSSALG